jgi:hypothetical protein
MKNDLEVTRPIEAADRQIEIERLFSTNYGHIMDAALSDRRLLVADAERIAQSLANHLGEYPGDLNDQSFMEWATAVIGPAVIRLQFFYDLYQQCRKKVLSGIWSILGQNLDLRDHSNVAFILEQIEGDTWAWALEHLDDLMIPGSAKLSTRLYAQGRFHAMTWRKNRLRDNERFDDADIFGFGDESGVNVDVDEAGRITTSCPIIFDPDHNGDDGDSDEIVSRPSGRTTPSPSDSAISMKSGRPRMLCPSGCGLQPISSSPATQKDALRLWCGHERPVFLPVAA